MTTKHNDELLVEFSQIVSAKCEEGTTNSSASFHLLNNSDDLLASFSMSSPAFDSPASDGSMEAFSITFNEIFQSGEISKFRILNKDEIEVMEGEVGLIGEPNVLEISNLFISENDEIRINSFTYYPQN